MPKVQKLSTINVSVFSADLKLIGFENRRELHLSCGLVNIARGNCNVIMRPDTNQTKGEILISSNVEHVEKFDKSFESDEDKNFFIKVESVSGNKCPRCWKYFEIDEKSVLCNRCKKVLDE